MLVNIMRSIVAALDFSGLPYIMNYSVSPLLDFALNILLDLHNHIVGLFLSSIGFFCVFLKKINGEGGLV